MFRERHAGLCREHLPFGLGDRASLFVGFTADEVALLIEVVLDRGVDGAGRERLSAMNWS